MCNLTYLKLQESWWFCHCDGHSGGLGPSMISRICTYTHIEVKVGKRSNEPGKTSIRGKHSKYRTKGGIFSIKKKRTRVRRWIRGQSNSSVISDDHRRVSVCCAFHVGLERGSKALRSVTSLWRRRCARWSFSVLY